MKGGFICPHCKTENACDCEACKPFINEGEFVNTWTEDGEAHICGKCKKVYSPDQALEEEYKKYNEDMLKQEQEVTEGTTPVEQLFHKLWDTPKDKWTWYAELAEAKRKEKERTMSAQMDMFNFLNNLDFGMQYLEKREQAEEFAENYGGNT